MGILFNRNDIIQQKTDFEILKEQMIKTTENGQNIYR